MTIKTTGTSPSPSRDEQKLNRAEGAGPADPQLTPSNLDAKLGRQEGQPSPPPELTPSHDEASRPGRQGKGARGR
jgi:hypothetical protein